MRQAKRSRIYEEAGTMQTCLQLCRILGNGCAARYTYISKYHMTRHRLLCRGATVYAASKAQPNIRRSRHDANLFAIVQDSWKRVCRKVHLYLKISHDKTPSALPRRYSICSKRSEAEYTKKPAQCKRVCRRHTYISKYHRQDNRLLCRGATVYAASEAKPNIHRNLGI